MAFDWRLPFRRPGKRAPEPNPHGSLHLPSNEYSTTVFTGSAPEWLDYLALSPEERFDPAWDIEIRYHSSEKVLDFIGGNEESKILANALQEGYAALRKNLETKPRVRQVLDDLVFTNRSNDDTRLLLRVSPCLPSLASREVALSKENRADETQIVLDLNSVETTIDRIQTYPGRDTAKTQIRLGLTWPLLRRVISQLSYPSFPRDRYLEKINLTTRMAVLNIHVIFREKKDGRLIPSKAGKIYQEHVSQRDGVPVDQLIERHPYFRMLKNLSFVLQENWTDSMLEPASVVVRDYLDTRYLRLSIASVMPEIGEEMLPAEVNWKENGKPRKIHKPAIGRYGLFDREDVEAWHQVENPFRDLGFVPVRQLGIGQFGRVYEVVNYRNGTIPRRVALKVDRLQRGKKSEAIEAADTILRVGRDLASCPHVIRIYDAGRLKKRNLTYHVIQLVDGDTLDSLIGITGTEHASIRRPKRKRTSLEELHTEVNEALGSSIDEAWRGHRLSLPFTRSLTIPLFLDLLTSILLWLEEVHDLGYAVNDLKNGNLMVSRRGQLKGIDLDSYAPAFSPIDLRVDYFFLAVSLLLFLFNFRSEKESGRSISGLLGKEKRLRDEIGKIWRSTDGAEVAILEALEELMGDLVVRSQAGIYAEDPGSFKQDIERVILFKRSIRGGEIILD